jgi:large subunit ribosomal protein L7/L12
MAYPDDEQTEFTLRLIEVGDKKISVIKAIGEINGLGRMEAKDLIERAPVDVLKRVPEAEARRGRELLEKGGAWVEIN